MSKPNSLRKDKTCLNCNYVVDKRFCPNCGQENTESRKTFFHLFVHFFEDLTHYENAFWKTIKYLIFRPASLSKEYLSGKRMSYLAPVRLYIFVSFVTFFLISTIPNEESKSDEKLNRYISIEDNRGTNAEGVIYYKKNSDNQDTPVKNSIKSKPKKDSIVNKINLLRKKGVISKNEADSLRNYIKLAKKRKSIEKEKKEVTFIKTKYKSVNALDSIQKFGKPSEKLSPIKYWFVYKILLVQEKYSKEEIKEKFIESFLHNLPKSLFIYMPLFAFILFLFQDKKKWYYFDHGIFTLHYFSFLLLGILLIKVFGYIFGFLDNFLIFMILEYIFTTVAILYMLYYFFPAHHRFYGDSRALTIIKGILIFFINIFFIFIILTLIVMYTFINIH
jgi:hypothetical protein